MRREVYLAGGQRSSYGDDPMTDEARSTAFVDEDRDLLRGSAQRESRAVPQEVAVRINVSSLAHAVVGVDRLDISTTWDG